MACVNLAKQSIGIGREEQKICVKIIHVVNIKSLL